MELLVEEKRKMASMSNLTVVIVSLCCCFSTGTLQGDEFGRRIWATNIGDKFG